jgi:hypothetical protein
MEARNIAITMLRLAIELHHTSFFSARGHDKIRHNVDVFQSFDPNTENGFCKENIDLGAAFELEQGQVFFDGVAFSTAADAAGFDIAFPAFAAYRDDMIFGLVQGVVGLAAFVGLDATVEALTLKNGIECAKGFQEVVESHFGQPAKSQTNAAAAAIMPHVTR